MKTFRTTKGPFRERPYYTNQEVENTCTDELRAVGLYPTTPGPVRIDRFVEKRFGVPPYTRISRMASSASRSSVRRESRRSSWPDRSTRTEPRPPNVASGRRSRMKPDTDCSTLTFFSKSRRRALSSGTFPIPLRRRSSAAMCRTLRRAIRPDMTGDGGNSRRIARSAPFSCLNRSSTRPWSRSFTPSGSLCIKTLERANRERHIEDQGETEVA